MALLDIIQAVASELGTVTIPDMVFGNTDPLVVTLLGLANREGKSLSSKYQWSALRKSIQFSAVAAGDQGALADIADGFKYMLGDTLWNADQRRPIQGGLTPQQYQQLVATQITGPWVRYTIYGGHLYFIPAPTAGDTILMEYMSKNWCTDENGLNASDKWATDTDLAILDDDLMVLGIRWRFLRAKGFDYAEEFAQYQSEVADAIARDGAPGHLVFGEAQGALGYPCYPEGSWNI